MSRFDTISRTESRASTVSRNQSLVSHPSQSLPVPQHRSPPQIKKNTAPHELKPSDILIERFTAWKQIVKMLIGERGSRTGGSTTDGSLL